MRPLAQAVPVALSGRDIIGIAKTGSGKTAGARACHQDCAAALTTARVLTIRRRGLLLLLGRRRRPRRGQPF